MLTARSISSPNTRRCTPRRLTACHRRRRACLKIRHGLFYIKPFYTRASTLIIKHKNFIYKKLSKNFADLKTCRTFAIANTKATINGAVVQLVRIHACHAWGRGFESRPHRRNPETKVSGFFVFRSISATLQHKILRKSAKVGRAAIQTARCAFMEVHNVDSLSANPGRGPGHNAGTTRTATRCRCIWMKKKKARQSDELCFLVASMKQHLQT